MDVQNYDALKAIFDELLADSPELKSRLVSEATRLVKERNIAFNPKLIAPCLDEWIWYCEYTDSDAYTIVYLPSADKRKMAQVLTKLLSDPRGNLPHSLLLSRAKSQFGKVDSDGKTVSARVFKLLFTTVLKRLLINGVITRIDPPKEPSYIMFSDSYS